MKFEVRPGRKNAVIIVPMPAKILLADDDNAFRQWATKILTGAEFDVVEAVDGESAVKAAGKGAGLFVLDVVMPKMLGTEVLETLRQNDKTRNVPIIFLVSSEQELRELSIEDEDHRAEDMLRKPMSADSLLRVVGKWVDRPRPQGLPAGADRRKFPRAPTDFEAEVHHAVDNESVGPFPPSRVISISEGGAFVLTPSPLEEGAVFTLALSVPGVDEAIRAKCRVVYTRGGREPGMGVVFQDLSDTDRSRIRLYVDLLSRVVRQ